MTILIQIPRWDSAIRSEVPKHASSQEANTHRLCWRSRGNRECTKIHRRLSTGVKADDIANGSMPFPGVSNEVGYRFEIVSSNQTIEKITNSREITS